MKPVYRVAWDGYDVTEGRDEYFYLSRNQRFTEYEEALAYVQRSKTANPARTYIILEDFSKDGIDAFWNKQLEHVD